MLLLGRAPDLVRLLHQQGCRIVSVGTTGETRESDAEYCERVIVGGIQEIDLGAELDGEKFDVVVSVDSLVDVSHPLHVLQTVKSFLQPDGYLLMSVPNVAHASIRLALLEGMFPGTDAARPDGPPLRFFTRESLERLVQEAEFGLARLEREEIPVEVSTFSQGKYEIPLDLVTELARDPDALTYRFIVMAYPMPREDLRAIQERMQRLVLDNEAAHRQLGELHELAIRVKQQERGIEFLRSEISRREKVAEDLQAHVHGLIGALGQRDAEIAERERSPQGEVIAGLEAEVAAYRQSKLVRIVRLYWSVRQRLF